jgi:HD superfamily phosphohydrolase
MKEEERIRCPIHDLISFKRSHPEDQLLWSLLQTPAVQRLRRIKQLGFSEFVYPGATHTRFSHVLGAMQMARRMLDAFEKDDIFKEVVNLKEERMATLAAALLHDIGHGPYSHVFEETCAEIGIDKDHESYTRDLLDTPEVKTELDKAGAYEGAKKFFSKEPGYSVFNAVISSQLDCDRLDFLCRDRHHTGIRSAAIDLEWLFDSLRIEKVIIDDDEATPRAYAFVFKEKGLAVAEEFVIAYMKMYDNVYFHKTTRGVQHLVKEMLLDVHKDWIGEAAIRDLPLIRFS